MAAIQGQRPGRASSPPTTRYLPEFLTPHSIGGNNLYVAIALLIRFYTYTRARTHAVYMYFIYSLTYYDRLPSSSCMKLVSIVPPVVEEPKKLFEWFTDESTMGEDTGTNSVVNNPGRFVGAVVTAVAEATGNSGIGRGV